MEWWQAIILGIIEGVTEFLPVSSTGHLTIVQKLMGMQLDDPSLVAFTVIIQIGAIIAAIINFCVFGCMTTKGERFKVSLLSLFDFFWKPNEILLKVKRSNRLSLRVEI
jgi:undecaprenyl pyrophosphate phosphatase UppP